MLFISLKSGRVQGGGFGGDGVIVVHTGLPVAIAATSDKVVLRLIEKISHALFQLDRGMDSCGWVRVVVRDRRRGGRCRRRPQRHCRELSATSGEVMATVAATADATCPTVVEAALFGSSAEGGSHSHRGPARPIVDPGRDSCQGRSRLNPRRPSAH